MDKTRLEIFSDGVMAIAATLLVLDLVAPGAPDSKELLRQLGGEWPFYLAYAVSFLTIGVIWINHHATLRRVAEVDHGGLVLNVVLLLFISILPWTTKLLAENLRYGGARVAAVIYGAAFFCFAVTFYAFQHHLLFSSGCKLVDDLDMVARDRVDVRNRVGLAPYLVATGLGFASAWATLGVCGAIAVYYALPGTIYGSPPSGNDRGRRPH